MELKTSKPATSPFSTATVGNCAEIVMPSSAPGPGRGSENHDNFRDNFVLKGVQKTSVKKRHRGRGRRKPKRKENRRRARPGRSRSGFRAIGAPFNNNEFLINQRDEVNKEGVHCGENRGLLQQHRGDCCHQNNVCAEAMKYDCEAALVLSERDSSSRSADTSDYESLHSPTSESSSGSSNHWDVEADNLPDESFDMDFAVRNFEADYSAQQLQMKEQLVTLPRQQLEMRCSLLMDQLKDLEERSGVMHEMDRIRELELELESLREENRRLKGINAGSSPTVE